MRYGWHGVHALYACVDEEYRQESWQIYTADLLCLIARPYYESTIPLYSEIIEGNSAKNEMTTDEIFDQVLNKLDEYIKKGA